MSYPISTFSVRVVLKCGAVSGNSDPEQRMEVKNKSLLEIVSVLLLAGGLVLVAYQVNQAISKDLASDE